MINVTLYFVDHHPECKQALDDLNSISKEIPLKLILIDINQNQYLKEKMGNAVPVVEVGPYLHAAPFSRQDLRIMLQAAVDRSRQIDRLEKTDGKAMVSGQRSGSSSDRLTMWLSQHFMLLFNLAALIYVGLPFLAPVFLRMEMEIPANIIYAIYKPMCHQLAFRSWFIFGEQAFYPRALANVSGVISYETAINPDSLDLNFARNFNGNEQIGYKVALCQRDVAMYGSFVLFGLVFVISGRKCKPLPWYLWILLSLVPIGFDGISQLPGLSGSLPDWLPIRESTPYLRVITGFCFGFFTGWYLFPLVEQTMQETRILMQRKIASSQQVSE